MLKIVGIILLVLGIVVLVVPSISFTREEKVLDLGPIEATAQKRETVPLSPILGVSVLVVGAGLLAFGATRRA